MSTPRKWSRPEQAAGPAHSHPSPQGLLLFACSQIGHKTCTRYSVICVLHNIRVFNQRWRKAPWHDPIYIGGEIWISIFVYFISPFLRRPASQRRDGAWLIPRLPRFIRPFSQRRARRLNIADMLSRANPFICNYGRKDSPNLVAYSNTHSKHINPFKINLRLFESSPKRSKFHLFVNGESSWGGKMMSHEISQKHMENIGYPVLWLQFLIVKCLLS